MRTISFCVACELLFISIVCGVFCFLGIQEIDFLWSSIVGVIATHIFHIVVGMVKVGVGQHGSTAGYTPLPGTLLLVVSP